MLFVFVVVALGWNADYLWMYYIQFYDANAIITNRKLSGLNTKSNEYTALKC